MKIRSTNREGVSVSRRFFDVNLAESSRKQIGKINQQKKLLEEVNPRES